MKIIKPSFEIMNISSYNPLKDIEKIARTCYKSEDCITEDSASRFVKVLINCGHEAMLEHVSISIKVICDRGVTHEIVRHRVASYAQESTRYCNYSKDKFGNELTFIKPCFLDFDSQEDYYKSTVWINAMEYCETRYFDLLRSGMTPQEARSVLPNSLKTEIIMTMNLREWRHFLKLRCAKDAHPQIKEIAIQILLQLRMLIPIVFDDIKYDEEFKEKYLK